MVILSNNQIQLEQEILGAMLKNSTLTIDARNSIKPDMFLYSKHIRIYLGILAMLKNKLEIDLITFLEYHRNVINDMDGASYISEIFTCNASDLGFNTKLEMLINNYKKHLYLEMAEKINGDMNLEDIEDELEDIKVKIHKCNVKKEIDIEAQYDEYIKWLYDENRDKGMKSGFINIDKYLGNFQKGRLITVFARSGVGKTTFSLQLASNMALNGYKIFYGSAEMTRKQVFNKIAGSYLSISTKSIDEDTILEEDKDNISKFMARLISNKIYISTETDFEKFVNEIKVYKMQNILDIVFVDYINKYIDFSDKDLMTNRLGKISGILKNIAMEEDICIVLLAQANRVVDKKNGDMAVEKIDSSDIQDSARIEQDSDQVIALYRNIKLDDKVYRDMLFKQGKLKYHSKNADENPECMNAVIIKNRHGSRGTCALKWNGRYSRVSDF
ncbi:DnaB-like helicase C-terminal domain-containing protein [Clostridium sp. D53t1_180928_C8]|uniref:replicative DNA helicase n=1 Tax=Clostridium sp. D53t1_180928_C8 TaxID=2787101 RepID=UPI0018A8A5DC|nr:DnaB-like helicase C-terminal domain-containing protein [Clostridium sp. D53t1_180928_C8]